MERFAILPFGCVSESSVAVAVRQQPRRSNSKPADTRSTSATRTRHEEDDDDDEESISMKPDISTGFRKLFKSFKTFSQLFVYKEMEDSDEEMEIGLPTDVKHVAHVGLDESSGSSPSMSMGSWDNLFSPQFHFFTFPTDPSSHCEPTETRAAVQAFDVVRKVQDIKEEGDTRNATKEKSTGELSPSIARLQRSGSFFHGVFLKGPAFTNSPTGRNP